MKYKYHHIGIPTTEPHPDDKYYPEFKMWSRGYETNEFRIQWHRFDDDCPLHPLIKTVPHVAFSVDDLDEAVKGKIILQEPYYPRPGFRVAFIQEEGAPVEFIETKLSEEEVIRLRHQSDS